MIVMIHALHGKGYPGRQDSVHIDVLERVLKEGHGVTFDDRLVSQRLALPLLAKYKVRGTFFLNNKNDQARDKAVMCEMGVDRYFSHFPAPEYPPHYLAEYKFYSDADKRFRWFRDKNYTEYRKIADRLLGNMEVFLSPEELTGHELGLHTYSHPVDLKQLSFDEESSEWIKNLAWLSKYGEIKKAAFPLGRWSIHSMEILKSLGIEKMYLAEISALNELITRKDISRWK